MRASQLGNAAFEQDSESCNPLRGGMHQNRTCLGRILTDVTHILSRFTAWRRPVVIPPLVTTGPALARDQVFNVHVLLNRMVLKQIASNFPRYGRGASSKRTLACVRIIMSSSHAAAIDGLGRVRRSNLIFRASARSDRMRHPIVVVICASLAKRFRDLAPCDRMFEPASAISRYVRLVGPLPHCLHHHLR